MALAMPFLFDELGWPWQVHKCWEKIKRVLNPLERRLQQDNFNGYYYRSVGATPTPPASGSSRLIVVTGYIADNPNLYPNPKTVKLSLDENEKSPLWGKVEIKARGTMYPF